MKINFLTISRKNKIIILSVLGTLFLGLSGFLIWRVNQPETVSPEESEAGGPGSCCCFNSSLGCSGCASSCLEGNECKQVSNQGTCLKANGCGVCQKVYQGCYWSSEFGIENLYDCDGNLIEGDSGYCYCTTGSGADKCWDKSNQCMCANTCNPGPIEDTSCRQSKACEFPLNAFYNSSTGDCDCIRWDQQPTTYGLGSYCTTKPLQCSFSTSCEDEGMDDCGVSGDGQNKTGCTAIATCNAYCGGCSNLSVYKLYCKPKVQEITLSCWETGCNEANKNCPSNLECINNRCVNPDCSTESDCICNLQCWDTGCNDSDKRCPSNLDCVNNRCVNSECPSESDCICNLQCWDTGCNDLDKRCPSNLDCVNNRCVNSECPSESDCECNPQITVLNCWDTGCNDSDKRCPSNLNCVNNRCVNSECPSESDCECDIEPKNCWDRCQSDEECADPWTCEYVNYSYGYRCVNPQCKTEQDCQCPIELKNCWESCTSSNECQSPWVCISNKCVNSACPQESNCECPVIIESECGDGIMDHDAVPPEECEEGNPTGVMCTWDVCDPEDCTCPEIPEPECGDGNLDPNEECELGDPSGISCNWSVCNQDTCECPEPYCGDMTLDPDEECELGNPSGASCTWLECNHINCQCPEVPEPYCGDGNLDVDEECELGDPSGVSCTWMECEQSECECPEPRQETNPDWNIDKSVNGRCGLIKGEIYALGAYIIEIQNVGDGEGSLDKIVDELDSKVQESYINSISGDGDYENGYIIWDLQGEDEILDPGESVVFTYSILVPEEAFGTYQNVATGYTTENETFNDYEDIDLTCEIPEEPQEPPSGPAPQTGLFDTVLSKIIAGIILIMIGLSWGNIVKLNYTIRDFISNQRSKKFERRVGKKK